MKLTDNKKREVAARVEDIFGNDTMVNINFPVEGK